MTGSSFQEQAHGAQHDYRAGSPHLRHAHLYDGFVGRLGQTLEEIRGLGLDPTVLEIGAGDGAFVEPLLGFGADVTATEMSRHSVETLVARYGREERFDAVLDADGSLAPLGDRRFSAILYASVLHHIPDYVAAIDVAIDRHLSPGGTLVSIQDPMWYPGLARGVRPASDAAYLSWRLRQGELLRGVAARVRRARGGHDEDESADMVEYHVVRSGVNQREIVAAIDARFERVEVEEYWSTQSAVLQRAGEALRLRNTFALWCRGFAG